MELMTYKENGNKGRSRVKCVCDKCSTEYDILKAQETDRKKNNVICEGKNVCFDCVSKESKRRLVEAGTKALKSFDPETKRKYSSDAGKKGALSENSGRFTSERWHNMSKKDQKIQVTRASKALQDKLNSDPEYRENHFKKVLTQLKIGYVSNAHKEMHDRISHLGYVTHEVISSMCVDECQKDLKIVIEYNGDFWHCNPEKWKPDDFNSGIKMYAKDKWNLDFRRKMALKKLGYHVIVIWESEWIKDQDKCINYIINKTNEISKNREN